MRNFVAANNLSKKTKEEVIEIVKRFLKEAEGDAELLRDKLTGAGFKNIKITNNKKICVVQVSASGKTITLHQTN